MMLADDVEVTASGILEMGREEQLVDGTGAAEVEAGWLPYWASSSDLRIKEKSIRVRSRIKSI
jgi:hypothetical protein